MSSKVFDIVYVFFRIRDIPHFHYEELKYSRVLRPDQSSKQNRQTSRTQYEVKA